MKTLNELFRQLILSNELENNMALAYSFSDPDGTRSGKSGWSFGVCQFDTQNNEQSLACLKECGFSEVEIAGIVAQSINVVPFHRRLQAHAEIIARFDAGQLSRCLYSAMDFYARHKIPAVATDAILATADYINQYGSCGDGFAAYMRGLKRQPAAQDILDFKLDHTLYGKKRPADCWRRYTNLVILLDKEKL